MTKPSLGLICLILPYHNPSLKEERVETQAGISETVEQGCWLAYPLDGSANFIMQSGPTSLGMVLVTVDWTVLYRSTNVL